MNLNWFCKLIQRTTQTYLRISHPFPLLGSTFEQNPLNTQILVWLLFIVVGYSDCLTLEHEHVDERNPSMVAMLYFPPLDGRKFCCIV
jgi:hypothetical protein